MKIATQLMEQFFAPYAQTYQRLQWLGRAAADLGLKPYLVGGTVRDILLQQTFAQDCDVTFTDGNLSGLVDILSAHWQQELSKPVLRYSTFGTYTFCFKDGLHLDLVTARREVYATNGALPQVTPSDLPNDIARRDFTVNALALDLRPQQWCDLIDLCDGQSDLKRRQLRILHADSFVQDPTRIFRAARYAARLKFSLQADTLFLLRQAVDRHVLKTISTVRARVELEKILLEDDAPGALTLLQDWQLLQQLTTLDLTALFNADNFWRNLDKTQRAALRLLCLLQSCADYKTWMQVWQYPASICKEIDQILTLKQDLLDADKPITTLKKQVLSELANPFFLCGAQSPFLQQRYRDFVQWVQIKPLLSGHDLAEMGYSQGRQYSLILDAICQQKMNGKLTDKSAEVHFVFDNFSKG